MFEAFPTSVYTVLLFLGANLQNLTPAEANVDGFKAYPGMWWPQIQWKYIVVLIVPDDATCLQYCIENPGISCTAVIYGDPKIVCPTTTVCNPSGFAADEKACILIPCPIPVPPPPYGTPGTAGMTGYAIGQGYNTCPGKYWLPSSVCSLIGVVSASSYYKCPESCTRKRSLLAGTDRCNTASYDDNAKICYLYECSKPVSTSASSKGWTGFTTAQGLWGCYNTEEECRQNDVDVDIKQLFNLY